MKRQYEAMFLVNSSVGDGQKALEPVRRVLDRAGAEVLVCKAWDERKLAYEIRGQKRATYVLTYFLVDGSRVADIERDVQLSSDLLRVLVLNAEGVSREEMDRPTPAETGRSPQAEPDAARGEEVGREAPGRPAAPAADQAEAK